MGDFSSTLLLRLRHWQSDALTTRLDLIRMELLERNKENIAEYFKTRPTVAQACIGSTYIQCTVLVQSYIYTGYSHVFKRTTGILYTCTFCKSYL